MRIRFVAAALLAALAASSGRALALDVITRQGFSPEECKANLELPKGLEILRNVEEWSKLPR